MIKLSDLQKIYDVLLSGNISIITDVNIQLSITDYANYLINKHPWTQEEQESADLILKISNTVFMINYFNHIKPITQIIRLVHYQFNMRNRLKMNLKKILLL